MKIAFQFGKLLHAGRTLDFSRLWEDPRGLTGSEVACVCFAREMAKRGHSVTFFAPQPVVEGGNAEPFAVADLSSFGRRYFFC